ncbi:MAG TPA: hypothetical protein VFT22_04085 [Kofleriaceae bacterium]|nr:hypothetical protein [Kofleriaceae bacterium]
MTSETIEPLILNHSWDRSAWDLANLYLLSVGAKFLGKEAPRLVGISEEMTCYVSPDYFAEDDPFADFIVHEAAHIFHNCKRRAPRDAHEGVAARHRVPAARDLRVLVRGLRLHRRPREEPGRAPGLAADHGSERRISDERVDPSEVASIVAEAASARNSWKVILARCAPTTQPRSAFRVAREAIVARHLADGV